MKLVFNAPINSLSFGNVAYNLLREMYEADIELTYFPIGNDVNFKSFPNINKDFVKWFGSAINNRYKTLKRDVPTLKLWHINGSESKLTDRQFLYTFYELNAPTQEECCILNMQDHTFVSSRYSESIFNMVGNSNVSKCPIGFDKDFHKLQKQFLEDDIIHFGLMGKWEKRKHTEKIIKTWIKKYGNNPKYRLSACVINPFYKSEQMNQTVGNMLEGKPKPFNVSFIDFMPTNSEVNDYINAIDIELAGLSGAEGWGLPSFNASALGKWSIVLDATSHKDWANKDNSILISPNGLEPAYDGIFFQQGQPFNQGSIYTWSEDDLILAFEQAEKKAKTPNLEGEKLQNIFTYKKTLSNIIRKIK